jgi:hypothetical protein
MNNELSKDLESIWLASTNKLLIKWLRATLPTTECSPMGIFTISTTKAVTPDAEFQEYNLRYFVDGKESSGIYILLPIKSFKETFK